MSSTDDRHDQGRRPEGERDQPQPLVPADDEGQTQSTPRRGARTVLDERKRRMILAMVSNGSSRRVAARAVGCAPSTLSRAMARDPEFAAQLNQATQAAESEALMTIRRAARQEKYWRAAAWLLERRNPEDFAPHRPDTFTAAQVAQMLVQVGVLLAGDVPEESFGRALEKLGQVISEFQAGRNPAGNALGELE